MARRAKKAISQHSRKPNNLPGALIGVAILALVGFGGFLLGKQTPSSPSLIKSQTSTQKETLKNQNKIASPSATSTQTPTPTPDIYAGWNTLTTPTFSLRYPTHYSVKETDKDFFVFLLSQNQSMQMPELTIDARFQGSYARYPEAIRTTKNDLTKVKSEQLPNGVKISGIVGPGYGEGLPITTTIVRYKTSAIVASTIVADPTKIQVFDQIVASIKGN